MQLAETALNLVIIDACRVKGYDFLYSITKEILDLGRIGSLKNKNICLQENE